MSEEGIGRVDFFRELFRKSAKFAGQIAEDVLEPLDKLTKISDAAFTQKLMALTSYDGTTQLLASSRPPVFITGEPEGGLIAVVALCKNDGYLLSYTEYDDALLCCLCRDKHHFKRSENSVDIDLKTIPVIIKDDMICI